MMLMMMVHDRYIYIPLVKANTSPPFVIIESRLSQLVFSIVSARLPLPP